MRKILSIIMLLAIMLCACSQTPQNNAEDSSSTGDTSPSKATSSAISISSAEEQSAVTSSAVSSSETGENIPVTLSPEVKEYIKKRLAGLSLSDTYYNFKGVEELTPTSLAAYIREAYFDYHFAEVNRIEDEKQQRGERVTYEQIMQILKEEFEIDTFPYETIRQEDLYLQVSMTSANGLGKIISTTQNGDYLHVVVMRNEYYNWYEPKIFYEVDGKYFYKDWDLETSPYIIKKHEFIFKLREGKMPMLVEGRIIKPDSSSEK